MSGTVFQNDLFVVLCVPQLFQTHVHVFQPFAAIRLLDLDQIQCQVIAALQREKELGQKFHANFTDMLNGSGAPVMESCPACVGEAVLLSVRV